jgi:hypothetical protein
LYLSLFSLVCHENTVMVPSKLDLASTPLSYMVCNVCS